MDDRVHDVATPESQHPARRVARALGPVGKWWTYVPAALGIAAFLALTPAQGSRSRLLARRSRRRARSHRGAAAVALSGAAAFALGEACDRWLPQPPSPPGHDDPCKPVFPSGHTLGPAAVGLTTAYVLAREGRASASVAAPVAALLPLATASTRLLDEKHWASDIVGGYLGGIAVAALCLAAYEAAES